MASIRRQYFNPKLSGSFSGAAGFFKNRKFENKDEIVKELSKLRVYSLHKPARQKFPRRRIIIPFIDYQWCADLLDLQKYSKQNRGYRYLLVIIDGFSKFMFTVPLKDKTGNSLVKAFKKVFNKSKRKCKFLQVDMGTEFLNKRFKTLLKENGIELFHTYSKLKSVLVERANRTLMEKIQRYFTHTGKNTYIKVLDNIVNSYNSSYHSSIKMMPKEVTKENEHEVWLNLYSDLVTKMMKTRPKAKYKLNDIVRISKEKLTFEKGYKANWSEEIFRIKKINNTIPITYLLEDMNHEDITGGFYEEELQLYSDLTSDNSNHESGKFSEK